MTSLRQGSGRTIKEKEKEQLPSKQQVTWMDFFLSIEKRKSAILAI
jgi:hypothetical protein